MSLNCLNLYNLKLFQSALVWRLYFIMIKTNLPTLVTLNNCDELIEFACNGLADYPCDIVEFQGGILEVCRTGRQFPECTVGDILVSGREVNGCFFLQNVKGTLPMLTPTVMVPNYVKEEFIATLKGEW